MDAIRYFNRHRQAFETEQVYGESFLRWTYHSPFGALALHSLIKRKCFSSFYGSLMDRPNSAEKIPDFIKNYQLDPKEFAAPPESFQSFNEFFFRKLKASARPITPDPDVATFPADGRHLGFQRASEIEGVFVKGQSFRLPELLGDAALAERFEHGSLVLSRLCPVDYHRFHFPVSGTAQATQTIDGPLFSVSPIALRQQLSYLWTNKRTITQIQSPIFGTVLMLEIGATCVGSILQTYQAKGQVAKGDEKGYFAFGGSSTITIFEPGKISLADDLIEHSANQTELYAKMGTPMAILNA